MNNLILIIEALAIGLLTIRLYEQWWKIKGYKRYIDHLKTRDTEKTVTIKNLLRQVKELREQLKEQKREG